MKLLASIEKFLPRGIFHVLWGIPNPLINNVIIVIYIKTSKYNFLT